jgi:hypothetical protein
MKRRLDTLKVASSTFATATDTTLATAGIRPRRSSLTPVESLTPTSTAATTPTTTATATAAASTAMADQLSQARALQEQVEQQQRARQLELERERLRKEMDEMRNAMLAMVCRNSCY